MAQIDVVILLIAIWGAYRGWKNGLLKEVVSTLGFLLGLLIAYLLYARCGDYLSFYISDNVTMGKIIGRLVAFVLLWIVSPIVLGTLATLVTKTLKGLHLGFLNSLAGSVVGIVKYAILLSFIFAAMSVSGILSKEKRNQSVCYQTVAALASRVFDEFQWKSQPADNPEEETADTLWIPVHPKK